MKNRVKYHLILKYAYFSWIVNMFMCFLLPILLKDDRCRYGLSWWAHGIFVVYLIWSFLLEIVLFFCLTDACEQKLPEGLSKSSKFGYRLMRVYFILLGATESLISKAAEYTSVAFMVEIMKWIYEGLEQVDSGVDQDIDTINTDILSILFVVTVVTFCLTVTFPCFIFLSILIRPPEKTFYPLTAHTTRLLMVADLRLLSKYIERYTINYYGPLLCWDQPNFISLSWIKLIFEDLVQFIIQILFLYVIGGINALVITIALTLTGISMLSSFLIIYKKYTSNLQENDLKEVNDFIHENGLTDSSMNIGIAVNFIKSDIEKRLNRRSKSIY